MGNSPKGIREVSLMSIHIYSDLGTTTISLTSQSIVSTLLSEIQSKLNITQSFYLISQISETIDYLLTLKNHKLDFLRHNDELTVSLTKDLRSYSLIEHFFPVKIIGKGGFSVVVLARQQDTGQLFAIKSLEKTTLLSENRLPQIISEKEILKNSDHPFIVKLHMALQTQSRVHLIMEFCPGGELFFHLQHLKRLSEDQALFYFSEIVVALEYLHKNDIIYRDLKPENILLDCDGHIKLIDFGLSKQGIGRQGVTFSFCGSPEYMSPEVLNGLSHGRAVDFYGLGALLYEMLIGTPPFYDHSPSRMEWNILNTKPEFPKSLSKSCKDILSRLLEKEPEKRIGFHHGIEEIKSHSWCKSCNWTKIAQKQVNPPFVPGVRKSNLQKEFTNLPTSREMLLDKSEGNEQFIDNFDYNTPVKRKKKKILSIIPEVHESLTEVSSKKTEEKPQKFEEFSEESYVYSNSLESDTSVKINEIPFFMPRFFN